jgi:hypothetical protein
MNSANNVISPRKKCFQFKDLVISINSLRPTQYSFSKEKGWKIAKIVNFERVHFWKLNLLFK